MYCSNCGFKNKNENKFCTNCGQNLITVQNNSVKKTNGNQETSLALGIICLVSSFFISILCFIPGIISIVYANKYKKESGKLGVGFVLSLGGMIYSVVMLLLVLVFLFSIINWFSNVGSEINHNIITEYTNNLPNI